MCLNNKASLFGGLAMIKQPRSFKIYMILQSQEFTSLKRKIALINNAAQRILMVNCIVSTYKDGTGGESKHLIELIKYANINFNMILLLIMSRCPSINILFLFFKRLSKHIQTINHLLQKKLNIHFRRKNFQIK